jgi:hypothetical protein
MAFSGRTGGVALLGSGIPPVEKKESLRHMGC